MIEMLRQWHRRYFSDPQAVILAFLLLTGTLVMLFLGRMLAPLLTAIIIAYLLEGPIAWMERHGIRRLVGVGFAFVVFLSLVFIGSFAIFPVLWSQITDLVKELPQYIAQGQKVLLNLPERYAFISEEQVRDLVNGIRTQLGNLGQHVLAISIASVANLINILVYLVLVPFLVFFLLKDKRLILDWISLHLPRNRALAQDLWRDLDQQMGNYIRGKFWEILIVGGTAYFTFFLLGLDYALLLATLTGLSVLVPYIGAAAITIPVALIGYFQWGATNELAWLMVAYGILQALDGNVLAPLLFAKVVNLHPVAIIIAILIFGGLWGFWGIFFAIPLATLVSAVLASWPRTVDDPEQTQSASDLTTEQ
jgi:putative permease